MFENNVAKLQNNFKLRKHTAIYKILNDIPFNSNVLDIGCAQGYLSRLLKDKNCEVTGIEIDKIEGEKAKQFCKKVIFFDIEDYEIIKKELDNERFQCIVCSDILEHLYRPDKLLIFLKELLVPNGTIYASIPNIARIEYRINLLFGKFDYETAGILCKNHIRFFTRKSCIQLFNECGFKIEQIQYTGFASMIKLFPNLTTYQFLITAKEEDLK